jgi:hypothetical protein
MQFSCKNIPLEHHSDPGCPHCVIAMNINDYLLSMDAQEYAKDLVASSPAGRAVGKTTLGDAAIVGIVGGLAMVAAELIEGTGNPLLSGVLEVNFERILKEERALVRARGAV